MTYPTGDKYTGCWKAGQRSSKVRLKINHAAALTYALKGKMIYANGDIYHGNWEEGLPSGQGNLVCATGLTYTGQFANGQVYRRLLPVPLH